MSDVALPGSIEPAAHRSGPNLDGGFHPLTGIVYMGVIAAALLFVAYSIYADVDATGTRVTSYLPYILLFVALLIALGFEFVNGFHDTANAVATVIYTRSLPAHIAVVWSGMFNLFGVLLSSGAVAFGIVSLLPVELILQVGSGAGFAMVFALLIAAIIWNVGTWYFGLPASSSHTLIGSIMGSASPMPCCAAATAPPAWTGRRRPISARRCCCRPCSDLRWQRSCCLSSRPCCNAQRRAYSPSQRATSRRRGGSAAS
jgi:PiT family inorganic phosphate transporter